MFTKQRLIKQRLIAAGATAILTVALTACDGGGADDWVPADSADYDHDYGTGTRDTRPSAEADTVSGLRNTVRHLSRRTVRDTRPHLVKECASATRRVRHTSSTGTGSRRRTRTWYTTEHYRSCQKVRRGMRKRL